MQRIRTGRSGRLIGFAVAAAFAVPFGAAAETVLPQYPQANDAGSKLITEERAQQPAPYYEQNEQAQRAQPAQPAQPTARAPAPDLVVVTITPLTQPMMNERQRRESTFRSLDSSGDGELSMAEAGVNTQLLNAFQRLDRDGNRTIDRQEFARVQVDDEQKSASTASAAGGSSRDQAAAAERSPGPRLPSRSIEERSRFSIPGESR